jgi:hypothetical protein
MPFTFDHLTKAAIDEEDRQFRLDCTPHPVLANADDYESHLSDSDDLIELTEPLVDTANDRFVEDRTFEPPTAPRSLRNETHRPLHPRTGKPQSDRARDAKKERKAKKKEANRRTRSSCSLDITSRATILRTSLYSDSLPAAKGAYVGKHGTGDKKAPIYGLQHYLDQGYEVEHWGATYVLSSTPHFAVV